MQSIITKESLATKTIFSDLAEQFEQDRATREKYAKLYADRDAETERKSNFSAQ